MDDESSGLATAESKNKQSPKSLSNGSSFHSTNSSFSSTQSIGGVNEPVTIMKMMPLSRNLSHSRLELPVDSSLPPAKPPMRSLDVHTTAGTYTARPVKVVGDGPNAESQRFKTLLQNAHTGVQKSPTNEAIIIERKDRVQNSSNVDMNHYFSSARKTSKDNIVTLSFFVVGAFIFWLTHFGFFLLFILLKNKTYFS